MASSGQHMASSGQHMASSSITPEASVNIRCTRSQWGTMVYVVLRYLYTIILTDPIKYSSTWMLIRTTHLLQTTHLLHTYYKLHIQSDTGTLHLFLYIMICILHDTDSYIRWIIMAYSVAHFISRFPIRLWYKCYPTLCIKSHNRCNVVQCVNALVQCVNALIHYGALVDWRILLIHYLYDTLIQWYTKRFSYFLLIPPKDNWKLK